VSGGQPENPTPVTCEFLEVTLLYGKKLGRMSTVKPSQSLLRILTRLEWPISAM
jgi:hypothetical protein